MNDLTGTPVGAHDCPRPSRARRPIRADWISKTLAGVLLGGLLALGASGVLNELLRDLPLPVRGQLAMWSVAPVWLSVCSSVYFFASGPRAWGWLGLVTLITHALWWGLRHGVS